MMTDLLCFVMCLKLLKAAASAPSSWANWTLRRPQKTFLQAFGTFIWFQTWKIVLDLLKALAAFQAHLPRTVFLSFNWDNLSSCICMPTHSSAVRNFSLFSWLPVHPEQWAYLHISARDYEVNTHQSGRSVRLQPLKPWSVSSLTFREHFSKDEVSLKGPFHGKHMFLTFFK